MGRIGLLELFGLLAIVGVVGGIAYLVSLGTSRPRPLNAVPGGSPLAAPPGGGYYVRRGEQQFGPYSRDDLQRYVAEGRVLGTDYAWASGMANWTPVSAVLGAGAAGVPYLARSSGPSPVPPNLHWAAVLGLTVVTLGLFGPIWLIVQAVWIRKFDTSNTSAMLVGIYVAVVYGGVFFGTMFILANVSGIRAQREAVSVLQLVVSIVGLVLILAAVFGMRRSIEDQFTRVEPIGLRLSGVMTFFFAPFYFQYHLSRIAAWKQTGVLPPA